MERGNEDIELSFVLPCLNEAESLEACIKECLEALKYADVVGEIIIADNGSTDGSQHIATNAGARIIYVEEKGYGSALRGGFKAAKGRYIIMGDCDYSYRFTDMPRFLKPLRDGADFVMGCRLPSGGGTIEPGAMPFLNRWLGNPALSLVGRILFQVDIIDFHCGIRAFRREAILALPLESTGMEFASEMVALASMAGLRITQVPTTLRRDRRGRPPHLRPWRDGWRHLKLMLLTRKAGHARGARGRQQART